MTDKIVDDGTDVTDLVEDTGAKEGRNRLYRFYLFLKKYRVFIKYCVFF